MLCSQNFAAYSAKAGEGKLGFIGLAARLFAGAEGCWGSVPPARLRWSASAGQDLCRAGDRGWWGADGLYAAAARAGDTEDSADLDHRLIELQRLLGQRSRRTDAYRVRRGRTRAFRQLVRVMIQPFCPRPGSWRRLTLARTYCRQYSAGITRLG